MKWRQADPGAHWLPVRLNWEPSDLVKDPWGNDSVTRVLLVLILLLTDEETKASEGWVGLPKDTWLLVANSR